MLPQSPYIPYVNKLRRPGNPSRLLRNLRRPESRRPVPFRPSRSGVDGTPYEILHVGSAYGRLSPRYDGTRRNSFCRSPSAIVYWCSGAGYPRGSSLSFMLACIYYSPSFTHPSEIYDSCSHVLLTVRYNEMMQIRTKSATSANAAKLPQLTIYSVSKLPPYLL